MKPSQYLGTKLCDTPNATTKDKPRAYCSDIFTVQPGFFIEAGACGGEALSNSLYFEVKHNWTGLLAEPSPDFHDQLIKKNR